VKVVWSPALRSRVLGFCTDGIRYVTGEIALEQFASLLDRDSKFNYVSGQEEHGN